MDQLWLAIVQWLHTVGLHVDAGAARSVAEGAARATAQLDMPSLLALAAALGWASGFRLYAVVFLVGMMGVLGWMPLPPGLAVLQNPLVLTVSGAMLLVEFFADKVPWFDSAWDAIHAFIRVPAGALLSELASTFDPARTKGEHDLLAAYRSLSTRQQGALLEVARSMKPARKAAR